MFSYLQISASIQCIYIIIKLLKFLIFKTLHSNLNNILNMLLQTYLVTFYFTYLKGYNIKLAASRCQLLYPLWNLIHIRFLQTESFKESESWHIGMTLHLYNDAMLLMMMMFFNMCNSYSSFVFRQRTYMYIKNLLYIKRTIQRATEVKMEL